MREVLAVPYEAAQFVTIEVRHQGVGHYHVDSRGQQKLHCLQAITRRHDRISIPIEHHFQVPAQGRIVLDQKDTLALAGLMSRVQSIAC